MGLKKLVGNLAKAGGKLLAGKEKTKEDIDLELSQLEPRAQYNRTMARPRIAMALVGTLILGVLIQWVQQIFKVPPEEIITIPKYIVTFSKIVVSAIIGSRGLEKIIRKVL